MGINLIIPAAGEATRLRPLSSNTSKAMVRVNGKPTIDYILEQAFGLTEIDEIVIVDGKLTDIRDYCSKKHPGIKFVRQEKLNGPRFAIELGMKALDDASKPVAVWLGDAIILDDGLYLGTDFLLCKHVDDHSSWCMWDGTKFYDKPSHTIPNGVALVGLYSFSDGIRALESFTQTTGPEISEALEYYGSFDRVTTNQWYDIGQLSTYHRTCAALLNRKARAFNRLKYDHELGTITKTPDYHDHSSMDILRSEISWYSSLTPAQQCFVPRIYSTESEYELCMSFESGTLLSDLMLYENLTESSWEYILDKVFSIKTKYFNNTARDSEFIKTFRENSAWTWHNKTVDRLDKCSSFFNSITVSKLAELAENISRSTRPVETHHGDLHFGNILYNYTTDQIKLIDPRGSYGAWSQTSHGDDLYDWAKLAHDLYFGYNAMVADVGHNKTVQRVFLSKLREYDLPTELILQGGIVLLASCIPLHWDDRKRQQRFADRVHRYLYDGD